MTIFYTKHEGGRFNRLETEMDQVLVVTFLYANYDKEMRQSHFRGTTNDEFDMMVVYAVLFPDGEVWDAGIGGFRKTPGTFGPTLYDHIYSNSRPIETFFRKYNSGGFVYKIVKDETGQLKGLKVLMNPLPNSRTKSIFYFDNVDLIKEVLSDGDFQYTDAAEEEFYKAFNAAMEEIESVRFAGIIDSDGLLVNIPYIEIESLEERDRRIFRAGLEAGRYLTIKNKQS